MAQNYTHQSRECALCHRIGYRAFVPFGSEQWRCLHEMPCGERTAARTIRDHDLKVVAYGEQLTLVLGTRNHDLARAALTPAQRRQLRLDSDSLYVRRIDLGGWTAVDDVGAPAEAVPAVVFTTRHPGAQT